MEITEFIMYLYGASGHARVIMDSLWETGQTVNALVDDNLDLYEMDGIPVLHDSNGLSPFIVSIGVNATRKKVVQKLIAQGAVFGTAVHPSSIISSTVNVGEGSVVMPGALINAAVSIGKHCIINTGASIDHECQIGNFVHISPHATLCGNVIVGEGTWIGAGTTIIQGVTIGRWCLIGAGSVVTKDIPDGWMAVGNRCHLIKRINQELI